MIGAYPGSFDPPTVAHLAVACAAVAHAGLDRLDLVLSRTALGKQDRSACPVEDRLTVLQSVAATRPWLGVRVTDHQLLADIADGYDVVVMGADKWAQVLDPAWYSSSAARDEAVARLPRVLVAPRAGDRPSGVELLTLPEHLTDVSSSAVRAGRRSWLLPEAEALAASIGAGRTAEPDQDDLAPSDAERRRLECGQRRGWQVGHQ